MKQLPEISEATESVSSEEFNRLVRQVRLFGIALDSLNAQVDRDLAEVNPELGLRIQREWMIDEVTPLGAQIVAEFDVTGLAGKTPVVKVKASYRLFIGAGEMLPDAFFTHYMRSADMQVWPYLRELTSSLTARMSAPVMVLPPLLTSSELKSPRRRTSKRKDAAG